MNKRIIQSRGSNAANSLERAWIALRKIIPGLPSAVIVISSARRRARELGHFSPSCWRYVKDRNVHEVAISPVLFESVEDLLATLVHEAVHAVLFHTDSENPKHIAGCGPNGYYHRKEFRDRCREVGLDCEFLNNRYGWTITGWPVQGVPDHYREVLKLLKKEVPLGTGMQRIRKPRTGKMPESGHTRLTCSCKRQGREKRSVYVNSSMLQEGGVLCTLCGEEFLSSDVHTS